MVNLAGQLIEFIVSQVKATQMPIAIRRSCKSRHFADQLGNVFAFLTRQTNADKPINKLRAMAQKRLGLPELHFTSQSEIEKLKKENLWLRVKVNSLKTRLSDLTGGKEEMTLDKLDNVDLVGKVDKVEKVDKFCQTNLNSYSIDELVGDRVTLKRSGTKHLRCDEKKLLEELYEINGKLTATRDILRAASDF